MVQNHLFQLMALVAMEPPAGLDAVSIRDEKVKVFKASARSIRSISIRIRRPRPIHRRRRQRCKNAGLHQGERRPADSAKPRLSSR